MSTLNGDNLFLGTASLDAGYFQDDLLLLFGDEPIPANV